MCIRDRSWGITYVDSLRPGAPAWTAMETSAELDGLDQFGQTLVSNTISVSRLEESDAIDAIAPYQMLPLPRGSLNALKPQRLDTSGANPAKQVVVEVKAVGINFRDVLNVLDMYPGDPGDPGGDCAGVIVEGVLHHDGLVLAGPGDAVFGLAGGCLGSHVIASNKTVVPMPSNISFEEASTMPTVFVTVDTALNRLAGISEGDRVLLHGAAGGVGLAAMQMIEATGATPVVTAGSVSKRTMLRSIGGNEVFSSRDQHFAEESAVVGQAVSVAINTLTSAGFVASTLATLKKGAKFIEISKRDIWSTCRILQERPDVDYNLLAVDFMSAEALHSALMRVSHGVSTNTLKPLPLINHNIASIVDALRQMSQARHIGKIVVAPKPFFDKNGAQGTSIITGGTGKILR